MTEIKIEKKRSLWPWIVLGLILIASFLYYRSITSPEDEVLLAPEEIELINVNENSRAINDFVSFVESDTNHMSLDHTFTRDALFKLADAVYAITKQTGHELKADLAHVKRYAETITNEALVNTHADSIRKAADILSIELKQIQLSTFPTLTKEADNLRDASSAINPAVLTLDQKSAVKHFFKTAASLLRKMN